ncbi:phospholipid:diacylglycerol acyltransferase [Nematocida displodere]|uniref:Phospholipid:diacylglycerol acyltransferase n=1 Tax=Nematocida displodere TaxID=1805483 RepID=A0A177EHL2_9MICR|nr:phospholipid:diacylglycerol acyltransferase [Nematocida displodere]
MEKAKNIETPEQTRPTEMLCSRCEKNKPRKKKRYFLLCFLIAIATYLTKTAYEKAFKKTVILALLDDFLSLKYITGLNLSDTTKSNLFYLAELAASNPKPEVAPLPGIIAEKEGVNAKHPITIIPGIANTHLELWKTSAEATSFFRKKIWGSHSTFTFMLYDRAEWFSSMKLHEDTGLDPDKIKVRPGQGLDSSDFAIPGVWFWWKIVENLSHIGYDPTKVHFAAFDWRLGFEELEVRDGYFTKLKTDIEHQCATSQEKSVVIAHSLGSVIFHYFMQWVSDKEADWVDKHIHAVSYIGAPLLGAPKAIPCLLTGEAKDTAEMGAVQYAIVELLFGKDQRKELFRTWTSALFLLPKGNPCFWRDRTRKNVPDELVVITEDDKPAESLSIEEIYLAIQNVVTPYNKKVVQKMINCDSKQDKWSNPLLSPLPNAPNLTIYSLYGVNKPTERGYALYRDKDGTLEIDRNATDPSKNLHRGVYSTDGDGTVPVVSSGYMGLHGWKTPKLNPHKVKTLNKEYKHLPSKSILDIRGGRYTAQHVNILGNFELITDLLHIASGKTLHERIHSNLPKLIEEINKDLEP